MFLFLIEFNESFNPKRNASINLSIRFRFFGFVCLVLMWLLLQYCFFGLGFLWFGDKVFGPQQFPASFGFESWPDLVFSGCRNCFISGKLNDRSFVCLRGFVGLIATTVFWFFLGCTKYSL